MYLNDKFAIKACVIFFVLLSSFLPGCLGTENQDITNKPQTEQKILTISGSTTIQPVSELLAAAYMNQNQGVDIVITGGGSGTGIKETGEGIVDIGSASRPVKDSELSKYSDIKIHRVGASAIVIITSQMNDINTISYEEAQALYDDKSEDISAMPGISNIDSVIQRSEESGTEETFAGWLFAGEKNVDKSLETKDTGNMGEIRQFSAEGNAEVLRLVKDKRNSIGFVDFGYAESDPGVKILKIKDKGAETALPSDISQIREDILMELKCEKSNENCNNSFYITALTRPLNYITRGDISPLTKDFIDFASAPSSRAYFNEIGYFSIAELNQEV